MEKWDRESLTIDEIARCIGVCVTLEERVVVTFLADTGARKNELRRLRPDWVKFDHGKYGIMTIPPRDDYKPIPPRQRKNTKVEFIPRGPKTKVTRRVALTHRLSDILREWFTKRAWIMMTDKQIWALCVRIGKDAGIKKRVTAHIFRHSWVSNAYRAGLRPAQIAKKVGHVDARMVERVYLHIDDEETDAELDEGGMLDL